MTRPTGTGRIGRPPDPPHLRVLKGNAKASSSPLPPEADPEDPPDWLDDEALAIWHRYAPGMVRRKVVRFDDVPILAAWCHELACYIRTAKLVAGGGPLIASRRDQVRKNPAAQLARDHLTAFLALSSRLGMSPADRSRIVADEEYDARGVERLLSDPSRGA